MLQSALNERRFQLSARTAGKNDFEDQVDPFEVVRVWLVPTATKGTAGVGVSVALHCPACRRFTHVCLAVCACMPGDLSHFLYIPARYLVTANFGSSVARCRPPGSSGFSSYKSSEQANRPELITRQHAVRTPRAAGCLYA